MVVFVERCLTIGDTFVFSLNHEEGYCQDQKMIRNRWLKMDHTVWTTGIFFHDGRRLGCWRPWVFRHFKLKVGDSPRGFLDISVPLKIKGFPMSSERNPWFVRENQWKIQGLCFFFDLWHAPHIYVLLFLGWWSKYNPPLVRSIPQKKILQNTSWKWRKLSLQELLPLQLVQFSKQFFTER